MTLICDINFIVFVLLECLRIVCRSLHDHTYLNSELIIIIINVCVYYSYCYFIMFFKAFYSCMVGGSMCSE